MQCGREGEEESILGTVREEWPWLACPRSALHTIYFVCASIILL